MSRGEFIKLLILRSIGNFLLLFALFGVGATFGPTIYQEVLFRIGNFRGVTYAVEPTIKPETAPEVGFGELIESQQPEKSFTTVLAGSTEQVLRAKDPAFSLLIPKIGANAKVIPNVDATNEQEFLKALQTGIAHARGSVFPGIVGNTYLFAHSTDTWWHVGRYNAVFYLLKELKPGDEIVVFFENRRYNYTVAESRISDPSEVSLLVNRPTNEQQLILQTCWPPGTTWKRLFVIAKPKKI
jgi:LPXTG-site transpeptidase (sortase) family protein